MLQTIMEGTSTEVIDGLITVLFPDAESIYDPTYGNGVFWKGFLHPVLGSDILPTRSPDLVADFTRLPFKDETFDLVVFDPPFQTDMGKNKPSVMGKRFATYPTILELKWAVLQGVLECWRTCKLGIIVKVQDYNHANKKVWMSDWIREAIPVDPYDVVYLKQARKMNDPKWKNQLSVRTNHSTFWVYRKDGPIHKKRKSVWI